MKSYVKGMITGCLLFSIAILLMGSRDNNIAVGRYEYYISSDDITKKHYSRIFDTARGVVYHKEFIPGAEQVDIKWVNGEQVEKRYFRPDLTIWKSDNWDTFEKEYKRSKDLNF